MPVSLLWIGTPLRHRHRFVFSILFPLIDTCHDSRLPLWVTTHSGDYSIIVNWPKEQKNTSRQIISV
ncbi:hypothetical protein ACQRIT_001754 [Beauveria bassiana]